MKKRLMSPNVLHDEKKLKFNFVNRQVKRKSSFMTSFDTYIESSDLRFFNTIEEAQEEVITLTEEVFKHEKNTNRSRSIK